MPTDRGRIRHYREFYGCRPTAPSGSPAGGLSNVLVYGNCQAEAVRVLLEGSRRSAAELIRIPPVFELGAEDVRHLRRAAAQSHILLSQPIADNYRGLPLGTEQIAAMMPAGSRVIRWPAVRFAGLHPFHAIVRDPRDGGHNPPIVPYHDLRTLVAARTGEGRPSATPSAEAFRAVADESLEELRRRESRNCDVSISDLFERPEPDDMATINHPGNRILTELARRLQRAMGCTADATDPGRTLLGNVVAPLERPVAAALDLPVATRDTWLIGRRPVTRAAVRTAQMRWYADNPAVVDAGWTRHLHTMRLLGLS